MPELPTKRYHCGAFRSQGIAQEFQSPVGISPLRRGNVEHLSGLNSGNTSPSSLSARSQGNDSPLCTGGVLIQDASIRHRIFNEDSVEESFEVGFLSSLISFCFLCVCVRGKKDPDVRGQRFSFIRIAQSVYLIPALPFFFLV